MLGESIGVTQEGIRLSYDDEGLEKLYGGTEAFARKTGPALKATSIKAWDHEYAWLLVFVLPELSDEHYILLGSFPEKFKALRSALAIAPWTLPVVRKDIEKWAQFLLSMPASSCHIPNPVTGARMEELLGMGFRPGGYAPPEVLFPPSPSVAKGTPRNADR